VITGYCKAINCCIVRKNSWKVEKMRQNFVLKIKCNNV
jgi:hypothetical protein